MSERPNRVVITNTAIFLRRLRKELYYILAPTRRQYTVLTLPDSCYGSNENSGAFSDDSLPIGKHTNEEFSVLSGKALHPSEIFVLSLLGLRFSLVSNRMGEECFLRSSLRFR